MKKILIADDHPMLRRGLRHILLNGIDHLEFDEAGNAEELFEKIRQEKKDAIILDFEMPGKNGFEVLKQMKEENIHVPVLIFSSHSEEEIALRGLREGASGYIGKNAPDTELVAAVELILRGRRYISSSFAEQLPGYLEKMRDKPLHEY